MKSKKEIIYLINSLMALSIADTPKQLEDANASLRELETKLSKEEIKIGINSFEYVKQYLEFLKSIRETIKN